MSVESVTVIDGNNDNGMNNIPKLATFLEQLKQTTGLDVTEVINHLVNNSPKTISLENIKETIKPEKTS